MMMQSAQALFFSFSFSSLLSSLSFFFFSFFYMDDISA